MENQKEFTVLIVEDSPTQAFHLQFLLEKNNYEVALAENGVQAMNWIQNKKPSIIITDVLMPEMDGFELCEKIKSEDQTKHIPVILLTSLTETNELLRGFSCGADSFINKPFHPEFLLNQVKKILIPDNGNENDPSTNGVSFLFEGKKRTIQSEMNTVVNLMVNVYEGAIQQNIKLIKTQEELEILNESLEQQVEERTYALQKETEKLESQHALLSSLINSPADIIIFSLDTDYCYTSFNAPHKAEMKKIWDADIEIGKSLLNYMKIPELQYSAKTSFDRALSGESFREIQHQPGADIYYEFNWNPISEQNKITGITAFIRDITIAKKTEKEIKEKNFELSQLNAEKDKFFSILAHDLRSPFNSFIGLTELLHADTTTFSADQLKQLAGKMNLSAINLLKLLDNLLEWSML